LFCVCVSFLFMFTNALCFLVKLLKVVEPTFEGYQVMGRLTVLLKGDKTFEGQVRSPEMGSGIFRMRK
jgi:hypothetical protein